MTMTILRQVNFLFFKYFCFCAYIVLLLPVKLLNKVLHNPKKLSLSAAQN